MSSASPSRSTAGDSRGHQRETEGLFRLLEYWSVKQHLNWDPAATRRGLADAERDQPGDDVEQWFRRLIECGGSLGLRIGFYEGSLAEALQFVRHGQPVAYRIEAEGAAYPWLMITQTGWRRVRVWNGSDDVRDRWWRVSKLKRFLLQHGQQKGPFLVAQSCLPCQADTHSGDRGSQATSHEGHGTSGHNSQVPPFTRLLGLMRSDWPDIVTLFIYAVVIGILSLAAPLAVEALVNTVMFGRYRQPLLVLSILLFVFLGFAAALRSITVLVVEIMQRRVMIRVVTDLGYRLARVQQPALDGVYGPELVNRFFDTMNVQKVVSTLLLDGISLLVSTVIGLFVLAFYHPFLLGFDLVLLAMIAVLVFGLGRGGVRTAIRESLAKYAIGQWLEEIIRNPTAFRLHGGQQLAIDRADRLAVDYLEARTAHFRVLFRQIVTALGIQTIASTALLGLGGWLVLQGDLTPGQLVAAELIVTVVVGSVAKLGKQFEAFYDLLASIDKLGHLFDLPIEAQGGLVAPQPPGPASLKVNDLSLHLGNRNILHDEQFECRPGEVLAISGPSGAGKSMLLQVISGERPASSGSVEFDGMDLRQLSPNSVREQMGVARLLEVFDGSISDNVLLNRPQLDERDVRTALETVGLYEEVRALPNGLNTQLTAAGAPLSQGQLARLVLARAIASRPRLLLIDGVLDGLHADTLQHVWSKIIEKPRPWTVIAVSNRDEIISKCDRVMHLTPVEEAAISAASH